MGRGGGDAITSFFVLYSWLLFQPLLSMQGDMKRYVKTGLFYDPFFVPCLTPKVCVGSDDAKKCRLILARDGCPRNDRFPPAATPIFMGCQVVLLSHTTVAEVSRCCSGGHSVCCAVQSYSM